MKNIEKIQINWKSQEMNVKWNELIVVWYWVEWVDNNCLNVIDSILIYGWMLWDDWIDSLWTSPQPHFER